MSAYITDRPILAATGWRRVAVEPSSRAGYVNVRFADGPHAGTTLSIDDAGNEYTDETDPHDDDGPWEQHRLLGNRLVHDRDGMAAPVVYDYIAGAA